MKPIDDDGAAVAAARGRLANRGVAEDAPWRSTVVRGKTEVWVVRTWTRTPPGDARPTDTPDYVHHVSGDMSVLQVHPI